MNIHVEINPDEGERVSDGVRNTIAQLLAEGAISRGVAASYTERAELGGDFPAATRFQPAVVETVEVTSGVRASIDELVAGGHVSARTAARYVVK